MTDFIIDANILMSMLISGKAAYRPILSYYRFITPDFAFVEIDKYSPIINQKTKLNKEELRQWSYFVFSQIRTIPKYILTDETLGKTNKLLYDIDLKDTSYVALAMQLDLVLLTRDDILYKGLRKKGFRKVLKFEDFLRNI
jgi:predicted nucleic acid-binding protein